MPRIRMPEIYGKVREIVHQMREKDPEVSHIGKEAARSCRMDTITDPRGRRCFTRELCAESRNRHGKLWNLRVC
jgi:hypothetical protein